MDVDVDAIESLDAAVGFRKSLPTQDDLPLVRHHGRLVFCAHNAPVFLRRNSSTVTARMRTTPCTNIWTSARAPRRFRPLARTPSRKTPRNVPTTEPRPPVRAVPPKMTADRIVSSDPIPTFG